MKIDWLEGTVLGKSVDVALLELQDLFPHWQQLEHGGLGYECSAVVLDKGRVYWSGARPGNGVHFSLPPSAIELSNSDYMSYAQRFNALGAKFTRVDLAADDLKGIIKMETIGQAVELGQYISKAKKRPKEIIDHEGDGRTFYFGREQSKTRVRIYDKAAEQCAHGKLYFGHWVRVEMQLRAERAEAAVQYILEHPDDWQPQACGWLLTALDFKIPGTDSNKSRWETADWWLLFLDYASKERIFISRRVQTIDDVINWVEKYVAPSLSVLAFTIGHDELFQIIGEGSARLSQKQQDMIDSYGQMLGPTASSDGEIESPERDQDAEKL